MLSSTNTTTSETILSYDELFDLAEPNMSLPAASSTLATPSLTQSSSALDRQYLLLSQSLTELEQRFEQHRTELYLFLNQIVEAGLLESLTRNSNMQRQETRRYRFHPYGRSPSPPHTPSINNYINSPSTLTVRPQKLKTEPFSPTLLNRTAIDAEICGGDTRTLYL
jgi:hypothetical protein